MKQPPKQPIRHRCAALSILVFCGASGAVPASQAQLHMECEGSAPFTIVGAHVFDGERWLPPGTQVRVQHGLVLAVGPDVGLARGGTIIDGSGKTLLPEQADAAEMRTSRQAGSPAENAQSGRGAIVTGAHADLRLVEGDGGQSRSGLGAIIARWKNGILVGHHEMENNL